jgi:hypothetical protein
VLAGGLALTACGGAGATACPAVGWVNTVVVEFADDWPAVEGGVTLRCEPACHQPVLVDPATATVDPAGGAPATATFDMSTPDSVVIRVIGPDGTALAEVDADLEWERVGGSEDCGGPHEATVTVPAP